ncbi:MAG TPA: hypothetical protein H9669_03945 [Firmicutes bacterium]|nr:hypothetical protein [Bacillota bacterium]
MENLKTLILSITDVTDVSCRTPSRKIEFFTTPFPYHEQIASLQKAWGDHVVQFKYAE